MKQPSRELVDAFFAWYRGDPHAQNEDFYVGKLNLETLVGMSRDQFIEFFFKFAREGGKIQSGGYRTAPRFRETIEARYNEFRTFLLQPFEKGFDEIKWLNRIQEFTGLGQGLATIYLNRVDKNRFAVVNNKAVEAIELLGVEVPAVLARKYETVRDSEKRLIEWFPEFDNFYRVDALTQFLIGEEVGKRWANDLRREKAPQEKRYWIYAPGEQARLWEQYYREGVMGIGWDPLKRDLSDVKSEDDLRTIYGEAYGDSSTDMDFRQLCDFVLKMQKGDSVFVKRGTGEIVGYGEVASGYFYDGSREEYRNLRKANWLKRGQWSIPEGIKGLPVKTLTEIKERDRLDALLALIEERQVKNSGKVLFEKQAFDLLGGLHENPRVNFYEAHSEEFDEAIEKPLQRLMSNVAGALPASTTNGLETQRRIFSRIPKNDYGRGGAWDFYWGAFYPKGGKRTAEPQLYVFISAKNLRFGFYIGDYGVESRKRFVKNCGEHVAALKRLLEPMFSENDFVFGESHETERKHTVSTEGPKPTWEDWIADPEHIGFQAAIVLHPNEVVTMSEAALSSRVADVFQKVFPLVLLAQYDEPMSAIDRYLTVEPLDLKETNPVYLLEQLAADLHVERSDVLRWVRAMERKKQVIFYGPPGTGKTYAAKLLARHLIGGGDGFLDTLQFHPSYAYEDFMQGLRPKAAKGGGLDFAMVPGRFRDFCGRAMECRGPCVLIIDEINRANLARVFGELMYLLEYRTETMPLAGGERFEIPGNVLIIGTMNTADRSIALVDHALRRRFAFLPLYPNYEILRRYHQGYEFNPEGLISVLEQVNAAINDRHYSVGVSFFLDPEIKTKIEDIWQTEIEPYVEELFFDQPGKAELFAWDKVRDRIIGA